MNQPKEFAYYNGKEGIGYRSPCYLKHAVSKFPTMYDIRYMGLGLKMVFMNNTDDPEKLAEKNNPKCSCYALICYQVLIPNAKSRIHEYWAQIPDFTIPDSKLLDFFQTWEFFIFSKFSKSGSFYFILILSIFQVKWQNQETFHHLWSMPMSCVYRGTSSWRTKRTTTS